MNGQILLLAFLILMTAVLSSAQPPPRTPQDIRNETYERNRQIEEYDRNNRNNSVILRGNSISLAGRYKISGSEVRKYILAAQREATVAVVSAISGDMLLFNDGQNKKSVRIIGIDAPEPGQNFFDEARKTLSQLVSGKKVVLKYSLHNLTDENEHLLARVFIDGVDVGLNSIKNGSAWYREADKYFLEKTDGKIYEDAEAAAKAAKSGIWLEQNPQKPWEYREKTLREIMKAKKKPDQN